MTELFQSRSMQSFTLAVLCIIFLVAAMVERSLLDLVVAFVCFVFAVWLV